jgi:single-stranded DNA-specific DHH superfamily exonuclease
VAILNPHLKGNTYPNMHLTGCGVAFLLWYAVAESKGVSI